MAPGGLPVNSRFDLVIIGGGTGGCAAALAAARVGLRVLLTEEFDWIGGQLTSQAVPPDEHGWIEDFGCTASYRRFRDGVRDFYRRNYPLTQAAREAIHLNPGNGWVSPLCHEPLVGHAVLNSMLAPYEAAGRLTVMRRTRALSADVDGDTVRGIAVEHEGRVSVVTAPWFIDATELGDLLPLTGTEFVTGAEAQKETGEPSAPPEARPENAQAFSWCFTMEHHHGQSFVGDAPARYSYWRDYIPKLSPPWPGRLLSWTTPNPRTMAPNHYRFEPHAEAPKAFSGLWSYRRLRDRSLFEPGFFLSDVCLVNWPLIDFLDGDLCTASPDLRSRLLAEAREMSLCVFHWMQTEAPRPDGGLGWPGLKLAPAVTGTDTGLAMAPYIRESRRIRARKTITEQEVSADCRPGATFAEGYPDSAGIGSYRIDLHPSVGGDNYIDVPALPFQIPLSGLLPLRIKNLLAASKNIGTTHITNGCYRLHPVEWNIGEAAGLAVTFCERERIGFDELERRIGDFQKVLLGQGVELAWPASLDLAQGDAHRHAQ
jgi:hypothetical protein